MSGPAPCIKTRFRPPGAGRAAQPVPAPRALPRDRSRGGRPL